MRKKSWVLPDNVKVDKDLQKFLGTHPLVGKTLTRRGHDTAAKARSFLEPSFYQAAPATDLPDLAAASQILKNTISTGGRVAVWGDFDVDGQTSTALLVSALRDLGIDTVYYIPLRDTESHGINIPGLKQLLGPGIDLLLTCDTGIDDHEAVAYARRQGTDVIITDHHDLPDQLPDASAVINPNRLSSTHPLYNLPGAGVAYKVMEHLYQSLGKDPGHLLDLVALAVVSDVAVQTGDTRYLLQRGLETLRNSPRPALRALCQVIDLEPDQITESEIGFQIGPRLNAVGRLSDANPSVQFLMSSSADSAHAFALNLELLNQRRRGLTESIFQDALEVISLHPELLEDYSTLVLSSPDWHPGVIGIVASRLVERFLKPVILFVEEGDRLRGSARSVNGVSIIDCISSQSDLLTSFGGHPMAAGMELPARELSAFRRGLSKAILSSGYSPDKASTLKIDGFLSFSDLTLDLVDELHRMAPFGPGNPPLTLATQQVTLLNQAEIGRDRSHRKLTVKDPQGDIQEVLWWNSADLPPLPEHFDLAYQLSDNNFRGSRRVQITYQDARKRSDQPAQLPSRPQVLRTFDRRTIPDPAAELNRILDKHPDLQIWNEHHQSGSVPWNNRLNLKESRNLVVWTQPPSSLTLSECIKKVNPEAIYFFASRPPYPGLEDFLKGLTGMVKFDLQEERVNLNLSRLAAALGQTEGVVWKGLRWLEGRGLIHLHSRSRNLVEFGPGNGRPTEHGTDLSTDLKRAFAETLAYRLYYRNTKLDNLP